MEAPPKSNGRQASVTSSPSPVAGSAEQQSVGHQVGQLALCTSSVQSASKPLVRLQARLGR
jgi:hypothetical protein